MDPPGKEKTGRAIVVETVVAASPADAFRLWTTDEGTRNFFAPDGHVEARAGGRYEMIFNPKVDPEGARAGTKGAHVLRIEPDTSSRLRMERRRSRCPGI